MQFDQKLRRLVLLRGGSTGNRGGGGSGSGHRTSLLKAAITSAQSLASTRASASRSQGHNAGLHATVAIEFPRST